MTGIYVRVERNGKWENLEIEELTHEELKEFLKTKNSEWKDNLLELLLEYLHELSLLEGQKNRNVSF
ncbi:MAG: hypothetical protein QXF86_03225 [Candidatus Bilamarchaeaceae archaeon]